MPPDSPVNEEELNELLEQFKEANATLYQQLISVTGANDKTLKSFIASLAKNEKLNASSIKNILTATADSDGNVQTYLDNFVKNFEQVTNSSQDQINNILSGFGSQTAAFQKNLKNLQASGQDLSKATELGIGNLSKLLTSLSDTYSIMAQVQGDIVQTAQFDASAADGRSVEGGLLVELSNVSEFDGAINKFQDQITTLSDELLNAGKYLSDIQRKRIENTRKELGLEKGILEARRLTAAAIQDANGNYIDLEKTADSAAKLAEQFAKNIQEGNSHLNRQLNIGKELQALRKEEVASAILSGQLASDHVKSHQEMAKEVNNLATSQEKVKYLNDQIAEQQRFQEENADKVANAQSQLPELLEKQKQMMDELATTASATRRFELETNLKEVQEDLTDATNLIGTMDASKKSTIVLEAQVRGFGEMEESIDRSSQHADAIKQNQEAIDKVKAQREELIKTMQEGTTTDIISNTSGGSAGRGTSHISTEGEEVEEQLSSKSDFQEEAKRMLDEMTNTIAGHTDQIAERERDITKEKQNQIQATDTLRGIQQGAAQEAQKSYADAKKGIGELVKAQEEQLKSNTWGAYTDSAINSLDALENKILSTVDKIPFFGGAIKAHLTEPLKKVKSEIATEFTKTFNEIGSNIAKTKRLDMGGVSTQEDYTKHVGPKTEAEVTQIQADVDLSTNFITDIQKENEELIEELGSDSVTKERAAEIQAILDGNTQDIEVQQNRILTMNESLDIQDSRDSQSDLQKKISDNEGRKNLLEQQIASGPTSEVAIASIQTDITDNQQKKAEIEEKLKNQPIPFHEQTEMERRETAVMESEVSQLNENIKTDQAKVEDIGRGDRDATQELENRLQTIEGELKVDTTALDEVSDKLQTVDEFEIKTPFEFMNEGFSGLKDRITEIAGNLKILFNPAVLGMAILAGLIYLAFQRFLELDKAAEDFRREVGLGRDQTAEIEDVARNVNVEFQKFGISLEHAFHAAGALTSQFGTLVMATRENVELVALLAENHAVSTANAAGALDVLSRVGDGTAESARSAMHLATGMAKAAGVPLDKVMEDVAGASDETLALIRGSTKELIHASVEARRLGVSLESLSGAASHMLDFESSIRSEMEASVFAGRHLSFAKSRQLAFEGDIVGMQKASLETIKEAGDWTEMSYFQQKKLAEAAGMTVGEIGTQLTREKQLEALKHGTAEQQKMYNRYMQMQSDLQEGNNKSLEQQGEEMIKQELMQSKMNELKDRFKAIMTELGEKLLPLVEIGFSLLVPIVSALFEAAKLVLMPFTLLSDIVRALTGDFSGLGERFGSFGSIAYTALGLIIGSIVLLKTNFLGLGGIVSGMGSMVSGLWGTISGGVSSLGPALSGMFSGASGGLSTLWEGTKGFFSSAMESAGSLGTKLKDALGNLFGGGGGPAPDDITDAVPDIDTPDIDTGGSDQASSMMDKFNEIDMKQVLKAAAALLILAAAVWVTAKAFKEFSDVKWGGVAKGIVGITALVIAAKFMEKGSTAMIKGAVAIAILGAALVPAAFAFQMFSDVSWGSVLLGLAVLTILGVAAALIAPFAPLIIAGAVAIGVLGLALIPFAVAALVAGYAMGLVADAFVTMVGALQVLTLEDVLMIGLLGFAFAAMGLMIPFIILGAFAMGIMTVALIPLAAALAVAGGGMALFRWGLEGIGSALESLEDAPVDVLLDFFASLASPVMLAGAMIAMGIGVALMFLGAGALFASVGMLALGGAFALFEGPIVAVMTVMSGLIGNLVALALVSPMLILAAVGIGAVAVALFVLALATAAMAAANWLMGDDEGPIEQFIRLGQVGGELETAGNAIASFANAAGSIGNLDGVLEGVADGLEDIFEVMSGVPDTMGDKMAMVGRGMKDLLSAFGPEFLAFSVVADLEEPLEGLADGIYWLFDAMEDIDISLAPNLAIIGEGMGDLLGAFAGGALLELNEDVEDILEGLGGGIGEFFEGIEDVDPAIIPMLGTIGPGIAHLLVALGTEGLAEFDTDLEDVFEGLGEGIEEFMGSIEGFDADQVMAMSGMGAAVAQILEGLGGVGEIDFDGDDFEDVLASVGEGVESLFEPMRGMDDDLLEAARSVGGVLAGLFSNLGTIGEVGDDWDDVFEGFGEGLDEMFSEISDIDRKALKKAVLVGEVMADLFGAFEGFTLTEDLGDSVGNLGDGIEDLFDEIEHVDEDSMKLAGSVGRAITNLFKNLPLEAINQLNAETIAEQLEEFGIGIYEMFYEMEIDDFEDVLPLMAETGLAIKHVVIPIVETDMESIPSNIGGILENLGEGIYDLFDEMDDLGGEEDTMALMAGMGSFGQLLSGVAAISDTGVDIGALTTIAQSMKTIIGIIGDIFDEIEEEEESSWLSRSVSSVKSGPSEGAIDALIERMKAMGQGAKALIEGFGDMELLKELGSMDLGGVVGNMTQAINQMLSIMDMQMLGKEFETEDEATDFFTHLAVRMSLLGKGMQSIIQSFSDLDTLSALGEIDFDGIMSDMKHGIKGMMELTEWGWDTGTEEEETDYYAQIAQRMQSLGEGMQSIIGAFSDIDTLSALGDIELDDVMYDMKYGIKGMMNLVDVGSWWGESESEEDATKRFDEMSKRMKSLGEGVESIIGAFDADQLSGFENIELDDIMVEMKYGIKALMKLVDVNLWWEGDESEEDATKRFDEMSKRMQSLGEGVGSIVHAFSNVDALSALGDIELEDIMVDMKYGIKSMMNLVDVESWWDDDTQTSVFATKRFDEMSKRMKSLGEGVGSIVHAFSDIGTLSVLGDIDIENISEDMMDGMNEMMDGMQDIDLSALPIIYEVTPAIRAMVGSMEGLGSLANVDVEDIMEGMAEGLDEMMYVIEDFDDATISKFMKLGEAMALMSSAGMDISPVLNGLKSLASQEFADGLARATSAIYDFAHALMSLSAATDGEMSAPSGEAPEGGAGGAVGQGPTGAVTGGIPDAESLTGGSTGLDQLGKFSGGGFGTGSPNESTAMVVETVASVGQSGGSTDMSNVEAKLTELITLMKSGGIAVNLDGKKVHKGLASSIESSPLI